MQAAQPAAQFLAHLGVERAEGLVEQQHLGLDGQGARQCDALPLAAGELRRIAIGQPVELHEAEQLHDPALDLGIGRTLLARLDAQAEGDILEHRHVAEQRVVLEDETDIALAGVQVGRFGAGEEDLALHRLFPCRQ